MSSKDLWQVQAGAETTRGTVVTPTAKLMGVTDFKINPIEEAEVIQDLRGNLQPGYTAVKKRRAAEATLSMVLSYEDVLYLLQGLFAEDATPTGTDPYTWNFAAPTGQPTPRVQTLVEGDGTYAYGISGALATELSISGETGEKVTAEAAFIGVEGDQAALAALSDRSMNVVMGNHLALYIDTATGSVGTTQVQNTSFSFELTLSANRQNVFHLDAGVLTPSSYRDLKWTGTLNLHLELNATSDDYLNAMLDDSVLEKQIRLLFTSGTKVLQIDFAGVVVGGPEMFSDEDGVVTYDMEFQSKYNDQLANWLKVEVVNSVSAMV